MEVHHHTHSGPDMHRGSSKKKWTHYFWEFLMLFLAVFCGFLAENQREHYIEHGREKQFMKTLVADLKSDTTNFARSIGVFQANADRFDSLKKAIKDPFSEESLLVFNKAATIVHQFSSFNYSDRTIEQLRSAGNFRLIRKSIVSDTLIEYDRYIRRTYLPLESILAEQGLSLMKLQNKLVDYDVYNFLLTRNWDDRLAITKDSIPFALKFPDKEKLDEYYNAFGMYRNWCQRMVAHSKLAKQSAIQLIELIRREYHLD